MRHLRIQVTWKQCLVWSLLVAGCLGGGSRAQAQQVRLQEVIRAALSDNPSLHIQQDGVRVYEGAWQTLLGQFDPAVTVALAGNRDHTPLLTTGEFSNVRTDASTYSLGLQKQFRSGLTITPSVEMVRQDGLTGGTLNNAEVGVQLRMPLLRDRGVRANAAGERAAYHTYEASRLDLSETRAVVVLQAALAYWSYLAAWRTLAAYSESEARAQTLLNETKVLIEAEEQPAADLKQLEANLAAKTAQRIAAEQRLFETGQQLGLIMGMPFEQMRTLDQPTDVFPEIDDQLLDEIVQAEGYIDLARRRRLDLAAAQRREEAAEVLLRAARNDLKPRLDLTLDVGYAGLDAGTAFEQYLTPFGSHVGGVNVGATLSYSLPVGNRTAQGGVAQQASLYRQQTTLTHDLDRVIHSSVLVALKALERSIYELKSADAAVALYRTAVDNEKKKFQMGLATLIDVINVEDRLTDVILSHIAGQQRYANALVQIRYETGTLIYPNEEVVSPQRLTTVPDKDVP